MLVHQFFFSNDNRLVLSASNGKWSPQLEQMTKEYISNAVVPHMRKAVEVGFDLQLLRRISRRDERMLLFFGELVRKHSPVKRLTFSNATPEAKQAVKKIFGGRCTFKVPDIHDR